MTEHYDTKLSEVIALLKKQGYKVAEKPTLVLTRKDAQGYKIKYEIDLSQGVYVSCPTPKCSGRGRFQYFADQDGTIKCLDCKQPATLKAVDIVDELRKTLANDQ